MVFCEEIRFVEKAYNIVRKQKLVVIIGRSGSGKTATARHCALKLQKEGWQLVPIDDIREIKNVQARGKCAFIFDDPVGNLGLDERKVSDLERCHSDVLQLFRHDDHKIIITCRKIVYNEAKQYHIFDNYSVVDIEDKDCLLNLGEKRKLLQAYGIETLVDLSSLDRVDLMFPLMCYMLYKNSGGMSATSKAVLDPRDYLLKQLDIMSKSEGTKTLYASLVFLIINNNCCTTEDLKKTEILADISKKCGIHDHPPYGKEIQEKLKHSENTYVIRTEFGFKFLHESLFEIVAFHFGRDVDNQALILQHLNIEFLAKNTYLESSGDTSAEMGIKILPKNFKILAQRLFLDLQGIVTLNVQTGTLNSIFSNKCWRVDEFVGMFFSTIGKKTVVELFSKSYQILQEKTISREQKRGSAYLEKQEFIMGNHSGRDAAKITDGSKIRLIDWIICNGHLPFVHAFLPKSKKFPTWMSSPLIGNKRLFWLSIYSTERDMFEFTLSNLTKHQIDESINTPYHSYHTPLTLACSLNAFEIVKLLVERGAIIEKCNNRDELPLLIALKSGSEEIVKYLLLNRALVKGSFECVCPFYFASTGVNEGIFRLLLCNCDCSSTCHDGKTPLHLAVQYGFDDISENLVFHGADVNSIDELKETPLHIACSNNNEKIVKLLAEKGANFHIRNNSNMLPLQIAVINGFEDLLLNLLLEFPLQEFKSAINGCYIESVAHDQGSLQSAATYGADGILQYLFRKFSSENLRKFLRRCEIGSIIVDGKTSLHLAVDYRFSDEVECLIHRSSDINATDVKKETPLHIACSKNYPSIVKLLIKEGANIEMLNSANESPVCIAMNNGLQDILLCFMLTSPFQKFKSLLQKCSIENMHRSNINLFNAWSVNGFEGVMQYLLKCCPVENFRLLFKNNDFSSKSTPLHLAVKRGLINVAESLIDYGCNVNAVDEGNQTPLHIACSLNDIKSVELLVKANAHIIMSDLNNESPACVAARLRFENIVIYLLENCSAENLKLLLEKCETTSTFYKGKTSLHIAVEYGYNEVVEKLITRGANVNARDENGDTPLHFACAHNFRNIVQILLKKGADVEMYNSNNESPLFMTIEKGSVEILQYFMLTTPHQKFKLLLEKCNIEKLSISPESPLIVALRKGPNKTVQYLLKSCPIKNLKLLFDHSFTNYLSAKTPLHVAIERGLIEVAESLIRLGANVNAIDEIDQTPLHLACSRNDIKTVKLLVKEGANIFSYSANDETPMSLAAKNGLEEISQVLFKHCPPEYRKILKKL
ncbi:ankyrin-2-like [Saccostrea echinata]|uniref:ankyrin-2-like n=1 Tax=Saccostrea echinata TaxID=191078 RepID=UPI002A836712|nr:ankyrin-2-like [Saccostrea echinata]